MKKDGIHCNISYFKSCCHSEKIARLKTDQLLNVNVNTQKKEICYRYWYVIDRIPQIVYSSNINPHKSTWALKYGWGMKFWYFLPEHVEYSRQYRTMIQKIPLCRFAPSTFRYSTYVYVLVLWIFHIFWCLRGVLKIKNSDLKNVFTWRT